jgi:N-acylneuraminate cytidylyltransferase
LKIITLIPARGGSKGIPRKNIAALSGKPLIAHSIEYSLKCPLIHRTIVSSDDGEIIETAKKYGAEVPFVRPKHLAMDDTQDFPVFYHAVDWLKNNENYIPDLIIQLRPTSPIRPAGLLEEAIALMEKNPQADCLRTVVDSPITPYKTWIKDNGCIKPFVQLDGKESFNMPRQDLPEVLWHNGVIDIIRSRTILEKRSVSGDYILPFLMNETQLTVDIDRPVDLIIAESILNYMQER